jgi:hypothetical protein
MTCAIGFRIVGTPPLLGQVRWANTLGNRRPG